MAHGNLDIELSLNKKNDSYAIYSEAVYILSIGVIASFIVTICMLLP